MRYLKNFKILEALNRHPVINTQKKLAESCNISETTISEIITGRTNPNDFEERAIEKALSTHGLFPEIHYLSKQEAVLIADCRKHEQSLKIEKAS